jgi:peptidoglycan/LPS O-acetylase OafA/YrhL
MLLEFLAGVFIAWICMRFPRVNGTWWIVVSAVALLALMTPHFPHFPDGYSARMRVLTWGIPAIFIVAGVAFSEGRIAWPKWILLLGDASYSLYLVHNLVLDTVFRFCEWAGVFRHVTKPVEIALVSVCTLLSVSVAVPLYLWIERPMNEYLRKRFLRSSRPLQAQAASV